VEETPVNRSTYTPKVDIWETSDGYNLEVEMPGVDQPGVDIRFEDNVLTIIGRITSDRSENVGKSYSEYETGNYERSFTVSNDIDVDKIVASIKNGLLEISLPKVEAVKPRQIKVSGG
jgi:HSP20 family molecular chaperone IbpA